jgi:hypothetical protein
LDEARELSLTFFIILAILFILAILIIKVAMVGVAGLGGKFKHNLGHISCLLFFLTAIQSDCQLCLPLQTSHQIPSQ